MTKNIKKVVATLCCATLAVSMAACGGGESFMDCSTSTCEFDKNIFYRNDGTVHAADPSVITVGDAYYMYATQADSSGDCSYLRCWKSTNLTDWEEMGKAFIPARNSWAVTSLWAPEVIEHNGKFYMYYSGYDIARYRMCIGVAVADKPEGPFHELEGEFNGNTYTKEVCPFDFGFPVIDPNPFIDDNGDVYLYFSKDQVNRESSIYGCKLADDMVTVIPGSVTAEALAKLEQKWENASITNKWNEAPHMIKHNGKYMLLYSANFYQQRTYSIGVAVSDQPLANFAKVDYNPVLAAHPDWEWMSGTGHCSIFPSIDGKELFMAYHSHTDTEKGGAQRKISFDRVAFDGDGRLFVNGPSITPQLLPSGSSEYKNLALDAKVSSAYAVMNDRIINYNYDLVESHECAFDKDTTVTFDLGKNAKVKGILIYDSISFAGSADQVTVELGGKTFALKSNSKNKFVDAYGYEIKVAGSALTAVFDDVSCDKVTFTFAKGTSVSEIVIIGK